MATDKTQYYQPIAAKKASLLIIDKNKMPRQIMLNGDMTFGRDYQGALCDIRVSSDIVSRHHGEFIYDDSDDSYYYIDNNSTNGTFINGYKLQPYNQRGSKAVKLLDGNIIRVDRKNLHSPHPDSVVMIFSRCFDKDETWEKKQISGINEVTIGRGTNNIVKLNDMMASREHAIIRRNPDSSYVIYDLNSQNGVSVNGMKINNAVRLFNNDVIRIANTILVFAGDHVFYNNTTEKAGSLYVRIDRKTVNRGKRTLISDIKFEADSGDFILILGGSGAGKTTLVNAILGDGRAEGRVMLDGESLYDNFELMKSQIGIVPQFINLRVNDRVNNTLLDIADIKLDSRYYSKADKVKRINDIMERLGISGLQDHLISQLSGGQKKKVSVAAQLVGFQKVFICDEPDSGLDCASRRQQMQILKEISNNQKIVMVISHEPNDAIDMMTGECLFTKVLVLAKSSKDDCGHLAFYGTPQEALQYFNVSNLQDITYQINPPHEGGNGMADYFIERYAGKMGFNQQQNR